MSTHPDAPPHRRPKVLIAEPVDFDSEAAAAISACADVEFREVAAADLAAALDDCDAFWFRLAHVIDGQVLSPGLQCRIIASPVTGTDHIDTGLCERLGIRVLSLRGETELLREVRATAELTVGLAISAMRGIPPAWESVRQGNWDRDRFRGRELYGATAGIVGYGRLGRIVAGYLAAFGMAVLVHDRRRPPEPLPGGIRYCETLDELLGGSDLVSLHADYDAANHHLIGRRALAAMKPGAWLINTARGDLIDEAALLDALESGHLAGAAVDVVSGEPGVDRHHPLVAHARTHDNLIVVPHIGGNTYESFARTERFLARKLVATLAEIGLA